MERKLNLIGFALLAISLLVLSVSAGLYLKGTEEIPAPAVTDTNGISFDNYVIAEKEIPIVAVTSDGNGVIGHLSMKLIPGNDNIYVNTNALLQTDIQYSAKQAVDYALSQSTNDYNDDFILTYIAGDAQVIGGGSAGAATTILAEAALNDYDINPDTVITGTINPDGTIGPIGEVFEKAKAVAEAGYTTFLVPEGQTQLVYYHGEYIYPDGSIPSRRMNGLQTIDLKEYAKEQWGLNVVEVSSISDAIPYFFNGL